MTYITENNNYLDVSKVVSNKRITISSKTLIFILVGILLILIAGFRPIGIDRDSLNYVEALSEPINLLSKEPFFWIIREINEILFSGSARTFFLIFAILGVALKLLAIKRLSLLPIFSIFTYICLYFVLHEMTQIRVGVASGIFLLSIPDVYNRNFKTFLFKTALATMFHYSAIMMLMVYFLNPRKMNFKLFCLLPLIGIFSIFIFNSKVMISMLNFISLYLPDFLSYKLKLYIYLIEQGIFNKINLFNVYYGSLLIFYYIMILCSRHFKSKYDMLLLKIFGLMLFLFYFFHAVPVLAFRVSEFFGVVLIILIPNFILIFKQKNMIRVILTIWLATYFIFIMVLRLLNL